MRRHLIVASLVVCAALSAGLLHLHSANSAQSKEDKNLLSHDVYFTLKDKSPAAKKKLVDSCKKYLSGHEGEVFFAAGTLAESLKREVNDLDFDVALHIVFKDIDSQEKYQKAPRHLEFIKEGKDNWKKVRVFDSIVQR